MLASRGEGWGREKPACLPSNMSVIAHELEFASMNHVPIFLAILMQINISKAELENGSNIQSACVVGLLASFSLFFLFDLKNKQKPPVSL